VNVNIQVLVPRKPFVGADAAWYGPMGRAGRVKFVMK
jgi:hypothetical protein